MLFLLESPPYSTLKCMTVMTMTFYEILYSICNEEYKQTKNVDRGLQKRTFHKAISYLCVCPLSSNFVRITRSVEQSEDYLKLHSLVEDSKHIWFCHFDEDWVFESVSTQNEMRNKLKDKGYYPLKTGLEVILKWMKEKE